MFKSDAQLATVCHVLLARVRLGRLWTPSGPTNECIALLKKKGGPLSSGERILFLLAWTLWNGSGGVTVSDLVGTLDGGHLAAAGTLLVAFGSGPAAIDRWLEAQERGERQERTG